MDKLRHPHVIRTWTVERTKTPYRPAPPARVPRDPRQNAGRKLGKRTILASLAPKSDR